jgi:hypothetical protein
MTKELFQLFDRAFKFLMHSSPRTVISFINGLFDSQHSLDSAVTYLSPEFINLQLDKKVSDMFLEIGKGFRYLIEVQIQNDASMAVRIFEYSFAAAKADQAQEDGVITLTFPKAMVIYLEANSKTPREHSLRLQFPDGTYYTFKAGGFRLSEQSIEDLEEMEKTVEDLVQTERIERGDGGIIMDMVDAISYEIHKKYADTGEKTKMWSWEKEWAEKEKKWNKWRELDRVERELKQQVQQMEAQLLEERHRREELERKLREYENAKP